TAIRTTTLTRRLTPTPTPSKTTTNTFKPHPHGTTLITGTGALAHHIARWLAHHGTPHIHLTSRQGPNTPDIHHLVKELQQLGTTTTITTCDTTNPHQLKNLLTTIPTEHPLTAIYHTAGAPGGDPLETMDADGLVRPIAAKVMGAVLLDELLHDTPLDAFVLFSSNAGVWGSAGQGSYAAANAFLDALAERRRARGLAATSVAWGLWAGDGMGKAADDGYWRRRGLRPMDPRLAVAALQEALERDETFVAVADVDWETFAPAFTVSRPSPLLDDIPEARAALAGASGPDPARDAAPEAATGVELYGRLAGLSERERQRVLSELIRTHAASVLGHASADQVDEDRTFLELGFDSLTAVELRNRLSTAIGTRLPTTIVFDHPSPGALAVCLWEEYVRTAAPAGAAPASPEEARVRQALASVPLERLREAGVLDVLLRLAEAGADDGGLGRGDEGPGRNGDGLRASGAVGRSLDADGPGQPTRVADIDEIDELDAADLVRLALEGTDA
ncbi:beta-ketoacyl reductase, partial [Streptomyces sp. NPDC003077]|uniref:beta-ketoacyl reductase n=1 Tax=Streptomyces sp. NPDC003077 TaxID=3154443 RepID=UPI0033A2110F